MIKDTVKRLEEAIRRIQTSESRKKSELIALLSQLKGEVSRLKESHGDYARSIAGFAEVAAHEATRKKKSPELLKLSSEGLSRSVKDFETSHPKLVEAVNGLCQLLSNIGI